MTRDDRVLHFDEATDLFSAYFLKRLGVGVTATVQGDRLVIELDIPLHHCPKTLIVEPRSILAALDKEEIAQC